MIVAPAIETFLEAWPAERHPVLLEMENQAKNEEFPIVGPQVGQLLLTLARSIGARTVFEMGSGFGYSTAWFAQAIGDGTVVHTEWSEDRSKQAQQYLARLELPTTIDYRIGDAMNLLREDDQTWDIVFCDIDKEAYLEAWQLAKQKVRSGGLVLFDNALWHGRVADRSCQDNATRGVRAMLEAALGDGDFDATVLPLRDGVLVARRR